MAVSDLTGYTWVANSSIDVSLGEDFYIDFTSNSIIFDNIGIDDRGKLDYYNNNLGNVHVWEEGSWLDQAYRTIEITGGTDATNATLIAWLEENGTLTAPAPAEPLTSSFNETSVVDNSAYLSLYINGVEFKLEKGTASVSLISFYVNPPIVGEVAGYQAESGMTWAEWVASTYNTAGFFINNNEIINANGNWRITVQHIPVRGSDTITENFTYDQSSYGGGR